MKIERKSENIKLFEEILIGQVFENENDLFLKSDEEIVLNLSTGLVCKYSEFSNDTVFIVNAKIVVE